MRNIFTIVRRELKVYFFSPLAYVILAGFSAIMGWMFYALLTRYVSQLQQYTGLHMGKAMTLQEGLIRPLFGNMNLLLLFLVPFITMRLLSEERRNGTLVLLMTTPVSVIEIVLGKFFSALALVGVALAITLTYPAILMYLGHPDLGAILMNYLGTVLMVSCYAAVGIFFSAVTENQIVAGFLSLGTNLLFWLISWVDPTSKMGDICSYLSLITHYDRFGEGVLDLKDLVYLLSFVVVWLVFTHRVVESHRWK